MTDIEQWRKDRDEAFLSMDKDKILAYKVKYNIVHDEEVDDETFWASVHIGRTALLSLPENERRISMNWLTEREIRHFATDLEIYDK